MKKLVAGAAVAALLGSAAFADVNIGLGGNNVAAIGNKANSDGDGTDVGISNTTNWQSYGTRYGISFDGSTDNFGAHAQFNYNGDGGSDYSDMFDGAYVWYSPIEQLKLWFGQSAGGNPLRGDAIYGLWDIYRIGVETSGYKEGLTFQGQEVNGAVLEAHPIEGLSLYASLGYRNSKATEATETYSDGTHSLEKVAGMYGYYDDDGEWQFVDEEDVITTKVYADNLAEVFGRQSKYAIAYAIGGEAPLATIKVGFDTTPARVFVKDGDEAKEKDQNIINAAVDVKPMENLFFSVGAFIPLVQKQYVEMDDGKYYEVAVDQANKIGLYAKFGATE